jgi:hypothetical protein
VRFGGRADSRRAPVNLESMNTKALIRLFAVAAVAVAGTLLMTSNAFADAVTRALQEFIARRSQKRLIELMGSLEWDDSYDYKAERSRQ